MGSHEKRGGKQFVDYIESREFREFINNVNLMILVILASDSLCTIINRIGQDLVKD